MVASFEGLDVTITFGRQGRCLWCNASVSETGRELEFAAAAGSKPERVLACCDECEAALRRTQAAFEGKVPLFLTGLGLATALAAVGIFAHSSKPWLLHMVGVGTILFGITLVRLPFVTPQTVKLMGMRRGLGLGRATGWACLLGGIGLSAWIVRFLA